MLDRTTTGTATIDPTEVPIYVPSRGEHLGAVVTIPHDERSPFGVVLISGRARDRAHRNGMWVKAARILGSDGFYAVRLDYPGVGNSTGPPQVFDLERPPVWAIRDVCRFLLEETPVRRILLVGSCFGGRVALQAAPGIHEVEGVAVVAAPAFARAPTVRSRVRRLIKRVVGRVNVIPESSAGNRAQQAREVGPPVERRVSPAFASATRRFLRRGRLYFLYGREDFVYDEVRFALDRLRLPQGAWELAVIPGLVHSFQSTETQDRTVVSVTAWCRAAFTGGPTP
jgi:pimeloyl-ACP methyl ester carboxylesterase